MSEQPEESNSRSRRSRLSAAAAILAGFAAGLIARLATDDATAAILIGVGAGIVGGIAVQMVIARR